MSRSLTPPWLLPDLLDVAVTHGGNLVSVPLVTRKKKVQLVKVRAIANSNCCTCVEEVLTLGLF